MGMLEGKNAIITGSRRGIGRATVEVFAQNGANVWACARKPDASFDADMTALAAKYGVWIKPVFFDMASEADVKEGIKNIIKEKLPIDILLNNAGIRYNALLQMTSIKKMREVFEINFFSQVLIMQLVSRIMSKQKRGTIVNVSSIADRDGRATAGCYGASKAALSLVTRVAAQELASSGIRVNGVAPSYADTEMYRELDDVAKDAILNQSALGRAANPEEIAKIIMFLASEDSSFISGQVIRADGGM
jgi:3-oxoacyl-[acyl-carrier protein] reductase